MTCGVGKASLSDTSIGRGCRHPWQLVAPRAEQISLSNTRAHVTARGVEGTVSFRARVNYPSRGRTPPLYSVGDRRRALLPGHLLKLRDVKIRIESLRDKSSVSWPSYRHVSRLDDEDHSASGRGRNFSLRHHSGIHPLVKWFRNIYALG